MRQNLALVLKGNSILLARHGNHVFKGIIWLQLFLKTLAALHCFVLLILLFCTYVILEV